MKTVPEVKTRFLEALRSDKYQQGLGKLCDPQGRMCCLGVASDLFLQDHPEYVWDGRSSPSGAIFTPKDYDKLRGDVQVRYCLHPAVVQWLGWTDNAGEIGRIPDLKVRVGDATLAILNDAGFTFDQIADVIEYFL